MFLLKKVFHRFSSSRSRYLFQQMGKIIFFHPNVPIRIQWHFILDDRILANLYLIKFTTKQIFYYYFTKNRREFHDYVVSFFLNIMNFFKRSFCRNWKSVDHKTLIKKSIPIRGNLFIYRGSDKTNKTTIRF